MNCDWREKVASFVDDELDVAAQQEAAAHLAGCSECTAAVAEHLALKRAVRVSAKKFVASQSRQDYFDAAVMGVLCHAEGIETVDARQIGTVEEIVQKVSRSRRIETPIEMSCSEMFCGARGHLSFVKLRIVQGDAEGLELGALMSRSERNERGRINSSAKKDADRNVADHMPAN